MPGVPFTLDKFLQKKYNYVDYFLDKSVKLCYAIAIYPKLTSSGERGYKCEHRFNMQS